MQKSIVTAIAVIFFVALAVQTYMFYQLKNQVDQMTAKRDRNSFQLPNMAFDDQFIKSDGWDLGCRKVASSLH